jgi:hypothetical protein
MTHNNNNGAHNQLVVATKDLSEQFRASQMQFVSSGEAFLEYPQRLRGGGGMSTADLKKLADLVAAKMSHQNIGATQCYNCKEIFATKNALAEHAKAKHGRTIMSSGFRARSSVNNNKEIVATAVAESGKPATTSNYRNRRWRDRKDPNVCGMCKVDCGNKDALHRHLQVKHNTGPLVAKQQASSVARTTNNNNNTKNAVVAVAESKKKPVESSSSSSTVKTWSERLGAKQAAASLPAAEIAKAQANAIASTQSHQAKLDVEAVKRAAVRTAVHISADPGAKMDELVAGDANANNFCAAIDGMMSRWLNEDHFGKLNQVKKMRCIYTTLDNFLSSQDKFFEQSKLLVKDSYAEASRLFQTFATTVNKHRKEGNCVFCGQMPGGKKSCPQCTVTIASSSSTSASSSSSFVGVQNVNNSCALSAMTAALSPIAEEIKNYCSSTTSSNSVLQLFEKNPSTSLVRKLADEILGKRTPGVPLPELPFQQFSLALGLSPTALLPFVDFGQAKFTEIDSIEFITADCTFTPSPLKFLQDKIAAHGCSLFFESPLGVFFRMPEKVTLELSDLEPIMISGTMLLPISTIHHYGSSVGGHWTASTRIRGTNKWQHFNDNRGPQPTKTHVNQVAAIFCAMIHNQADLDAWLGRKAQAVAAVATSSTSTASSSSTTTSSATTSSVASTSEVAKLMAEIAHLRLENEKMIRERDAGREREAVLITVNSMSAKSTLNSDAAAHARLADLERRVQQEARARQIAESNAAAASTARDEAANEASNERARAQASFQREREQTKIAYEAKKRADEAQMKLLEKSAERKTADQLRERAEQQAEIASTKATEISKQLFETVSTARREKSCQQDRIDSLEQELQRVRCNAQTTFSDTTQQSNRIAQLQRQAEDTKQQLFAEQAGKQQLSREATEQNANIRALQVALNQEKAKCEAEAKGFQQHWNQAQSKIAASAEENQMLNESLDQRRLQLERQAQQIAALAAQLDVANRPLKRGRLRSHAPRASLANEISDEDERPRQNYRAERPDSPDPIQPLNIDEEDPEVSAPPKVAFAVEEEVDEPHHAMTTNRKSVDRDGSVSAVAQTSSRQSSTRRAASVVQPDAEAEEAVVAQSSLPRQSQQRQSSTSQSRAPSVVHADHDDEDDDDSQRHASADPGNRFVAEE